MCSFVLACFKIFIQAVKMFVLYTHNYAFFEFKLFVSFKCPLFRTNVITNAFRGRKKRGERKQMSTKKRITKNLTISYDGVLDSISFNFFF